MHGAALITTVLNDPVAGPQKFGVVVDDFANLAGATDFIVSFVDSLVRAADDREIVLILRAPAKWYRPISLARFARAILQGRIRETYPHWQHQLSLLRQSGLADLPVLVTERTGKALLDLCKSNNIDVVGPLGAAIRGAFPMPWIGWIYDFQHRYLSEFFSQKEVRGRNHAFKLMLAKADAVVVNASNVKTDAEKFFPGMADRVIALPFSAAPKCEWFGEDTEVVCRKYNIAPRYFLISNQFWIHKRHETALKAFAEVAQIDTTVELVLTGQTHDPRAPNRLADLKLLSAKLGIAERVHILGLIPKLEQIAIMQGAIAVVQPTAFEGGPGGGSVFDAVALGVPTIVSDIPVNREIQSYVTNYFPLDDAEALARIMQNTMKIVHPNRSAEELISAGNLRRYEAGCAIWRAASLAYKNFHAK
ncbi:MAG: glycosyltransferase [Rhizobiaceae bacterium]